jgi:hypothetical protein
MSDGSRFPLSIIEDCIPELTRIATREWLSLPAREVLSFDEVIDHFGHLLPIKINLKREKIMFKKIRESLKIRFIESQRLLRINDDLRSEPLRNRSLKMELSVVKYSNDLSENIKSELAEYGKLSQSLDSTFPKRLLESSEDVEFTEQELREHLNKLEKKRHNLVNVGLLDREEDSNFQIPNSISEGNQKVLSVYIRDTEKNLMFLISLLRK